MKIRIILSLFLIIGCGFTLYGQKKSRKVTITGTVLDASHKPVEGAAIFVDKVKTNSVSDQQGHFKVKVSSDAKEILVFTLFNGASEELIEGRTAIEFILSDKSAEDAGPGTPVINEGSGKSENREALDVLDVRAAEFSSSQTIYDMIRGRFPGVEVSGNSIRVAGSSSLNVSTEPLFVVDGTIVQSIDDISPQTVKSIEVLKGPEASVYGMRGANGVIVITRISGKDK
jgi:TonB-dependent SusC/RagA subfamily outer membrane receptor